jgi:hypothetical protein
MEQVDTVTGRIQHLLEQKCYFKSLKVLWRQKISDNLGKAIKQCPEVND